MDAALAWLEGHKQGPFFAWIHLYDAHTPYEPPEPFLSKFGGRGLAGLYDGEIAFADEQVGRFVSWLRSNGIDQKTVVVIIGDHGEGLGSHGEGTHGYFVYDYATRVPFLVVTPFAELRGVRVDSQVSSVDVFPTVLGLCGIGDGPKVQGRSLLPVMFDPGSPVETYAYAESMTPSLQFGWSALHSLRSTRYKLIEAPRPELFDLSADPGEETNVFDRNPAVASRLKARLDRLMAETSRGCAGPGGRRPRPGDAPEAGRARVRRRARGAEDVRREGVAGRPQGQAARLHGRPGGGRDDREGRLCRRRADAGVGAARRPRGCPRPC